MVVTYNWFHIYMLKDMSVRHLVYSNMKLPYYQHLKL